MSYCYYHALIPATYRCDHCDKEVCDSCINDGQLGRSPYCLQCEHTLESLGAGHHIEPFWRQLQTVFRYPLQRDSIALIVGASIFAPLAMYLGFLGVIAMFIVSGIFIKYCFTCLSHTAQGLMQAPDISEAYEGGLIILLKLLAILVLLSVVISLAYAFVGPELGGLLSFLSILAVPAMLMVFASTESVADAINPSQLIRVVKAIGLPYGLLLAFLMIMMASVGFISELLSYLGQGSVQLVANSLATNYYCIVMFHLLGYTVFQYQHAFGFHARADYGVREQRHSERDIFAAKLRTTAIDAHFKKLHVLYKQALTRFPQDLDFANQYFDFLLATKDRHELETYASQYLSLLERLGRSDQLNIAYKKILPLLPQFKPETAAARLRLAKACLQAGDAPRAACLLSGIQKTFPDFEALDQAFSVLAEALDQIPSMAAKANDVRRFAEQWRIRFEREKFQSGEHRLTILDEVELAKQSDKAVDRGQHLNRTGEYPSVDSRS